MYEVLISNNLVEAKCLKLVFLSNLSKSTVYEINLYPSLPKTIIVAPFTI